MIMQNDGSAAALPFFRFSHMLSIENFCQKVQKFSIDKIRLSNAAKNAPEGAISVLPF